jgi:hypothetical protein
LLPITDISGNKEQLTGIKGLKRNRKVNGEKTVGFFVVPDAINVHSFPLIETESTVTFDGEDYVIKQLNEKGIGYKSIKEARSVHQFFCDMKGTFEHGTQNGSLSFGAALSFVFSDTPYTFNIIDSFTAETFENFGRDNKLALFREVLERYGAEFYVVGNTVNLKREIGNKADFQYRYAHNVKTIDFQRSTTNLATIIRGYGGEPDDDGNYPLEVEYRSPNETIFGEIEAPPVYNESITTEAEMLAVLEKTIIDAPQLSITIDFSDLRTSGYLYNAPNEGDYGFIIYEPMNINIEARIVEVEEEFDADLKPIKTLVTLSNIRQGFSDIMTRFSDTSKAVNRIINGQQKLPYNVLDDAVKLATEAIKSAQTELEFENGIIARDKVDPNRLVVLNSAGLGVSTDAGTTFGDTITADGVVTSRLTAGQIHTNNIQIIGSDSLFYWDGTALMAIDAVDADKWVRLNSDGLYIAKGALTLERPDGFVVVNDGIQQNDFTIGGTYPTFTSSSVTVDGRYWSTTKDTPQDCHYFTFNHDARYLKVRVALYAESATAGSRMSIERSGNTLAQRTTYDTDSQSDLAVYGENLTVDLGIPTGDVMSVYVRLKTGVEGNRAYGRIIRVWKEG